MWQKDLVYGYDLVHVHGLCMNNSYAAIHSFHVILISRCADSKAAPSAIWSGRNDPCMLFVGIKELSRSSCRDPEVVAHPNHWDRNRMGGGYRSPRSWMISISTGITTTPILDNTLVVTLTLSRSIILKSNSSTFYISIASVHGRLHLGQSSDPTY